MYNEEQRFAADLRELAAADGALLLENEARWAADAPREERSAAMRAIWNRPRRAARHALRTALAAAAIAAALAVAVCAASPTLRARLRLTSAETGGEKRVEMTAPDGGALTPAELLSVDYTFPDTPGGYEVASWWKTHLGAWIEYRRDDGAYIELAIVSIYGTDGAVSAANSRYFSAEGADYAEEPEINGHSALLAVYGSELHALVSDVDAGCYITLDASGLTRDEAVAMLEQVRVTREAEE